MTTTHKIELFAFGLLTAVLLTYVLSLSTPKAGAASGFLPATIATTSPAVLTTTPSLVFATSSCVARIITTVASPIMLTFSDVQGVVPSAILGHLQPASTTVAYDSGLYGCGAVRAYSFTTATVTVSESR